MSVQAQRTLRRLVELAIESDEPAGLVKAAGAELGCPVGVIGRTGEALGWAPDDETGRRALAVARAAARSSLVPPRGWMVVELGHGAARLGLLAARRDDAGDGAAMELLDLVATLLTDQLRRAELLRRHDGDFVRRLVSDPPPPPHQARQEAAELGIALADRYRVGIVTWRAGAARAEALDLLEQEASAMVPGGMAKLLNGHLVLLHPATDATAGEAAADWFERVAGRTRDLAPASGARAIAAEDPTEIAALSRVVAALVALNRLGPRAREDRLLTWTREYALDRLLAREVRASSAVAFVRDHVGALVDWDRDHGTDYVRVVEAALDHPRHEEAARRCFVHRNTFRHRYRQALEILGDPLDDPDVRLAVHVALKLRRLLGDASARHMDQG